MTPISAYGSPRNSSHYRWVICALLFCAITLIYLERQVISILAPKLTEEFHWTEIDYSIFIVNAFTIGYAIGYSLVGRLMDWIGERRGFVLAVSVWSLVTMAQGLVNPLVYSGLPWLKAAFTGTFLGGLTPAFISVAGFSVVRSFLGLSEGGSFPGAIKTVGLWHPKSERALATGLFNAGSNTGIIIAAFAVPFIVETLQWSWSFAFMLTGTLGLLWVFLWWLLYDRPEKHPRVAPAELDFIRSDPPDPPVRIPWRSLLKHRQTWAYTLGMFLTGPAWWFYLFWLPKFLKNNHHVDLKHVFWALLVVYLMADIGGIGGGGISSWLIRRGASVNVARKTAFLICALCVLPVTSVARINNMWVAIIFIGVAAAAHQGFSANLYTIVSDTVPRKAVSSVVGIGGTAMNIGMLLLSTVVGISLYRSESVTGEKDYLIPFVIAGSVYLVATVVIHLLLPRLEPMKFDPEQES
jgi:ACS family hexuronate transporter-like MFS transporter